MVAHYEEMVEIWEKDIFLIQEVESQREEIGFLAHRKPEFLHQLPGAPAGDDDRGFGAERRKTPPNQLPHRARRAYHRSGKHRFCRVPTRKGVPVEGELDTGQHRRPPAESAEYEAVSGKDRSPEVGPVFLHRIKGDCGAEIDDNQVFLDN